MKKRITAVAAALLVAATPLCADDLKTTVWSAYGVSFKAPGDIVIEDDSEEGYIVSNDAYYITVQLLEGDGLTAAELPQELENIATDDEIGNRTKVEKFDLPQFYGVKLSGDCETDRCMYSYLLAKDGSCGFYVSIVYSPSGASPDEILNSFKIE